MSKSDQRGSKTSQACYSHPMCNLNLVRLLRFSLPLPVFGRLFFSPLTHAAINLQPPSNTVLYTKPQVLVRRCSSPPWCQTSDDTLPRSPSIVSPSPPGPCCRFPAFSSSPDMTSWVTRGRPYVKQRPRPQQPPRLHGGCSATGTRLLGFEAKSCGVLYGACCYVVGLKGGPCRPSV